MEILNEYLHIEGVSEMRQFFIANGKVQYLEKGDFFVRQGKPCQFVGFIQSGSFRFLSYTSEGQEQVVGYSFEEDFVTDYASLQLKRKSTYDIQAIKNSTLLALSREELNSFFESYQNKNLRIQITEVILSDIANRLVSLSCDSPEERYLKLISRYPEILNLVSLKEIASFINITPETLSRIRKKISVSKNP